MDVVRTKPSRAEGEGQGHDIDIARRGGVDFRLTPINLRYGRVVRRNHLVSLPGNEMKFVVV